MAGARGCRAAAPARRARLEKVHDPLGLEIVQIASYGVHDLQQALEMRLTEKAINLKGTEVGLGEVAGRDLKKFGEGDFFQTVKVGVFYCGSDGDVVWALAQAIARWNERAARDIGKRTVSFLRPRDGEWLGSEKNVVVHGWSISPPCC